MLQTSSVQYPPTNPRQGAMSTQLGGCSSPSSITESRLDSEEQRIVSLLGEHMPGSESSAGEPSSSMGAANLLQHFMAMRLLLLRRPSTRSPQENEMIDIIKNSFKAYSKDNRRTGAELANLLVKDWVCLKSTFSGASTGRSVLDPKPTIPRRTSSSSTQSNPLKPIMPVSFPAPPPTGPMNPPAQFVSPASMTTNMYTTATNNAFLGSLNNAQQGNQGYRRTSIDTNSSRRSSSLGESIEPQPIGSASQSNDDPNQPIPLGSIHPTIVMEN